MSEQARAAIGSETIEAVADRGYYSGEEIVACEQAGVTVFVINLKTAKSLGMTISPTLLAQADEVIE
jgi:hypothetical protein